VLLMNERTGSPARARNLAGFLLIAVPSVVAAVLLVLAIPYYAGASARIASLYAGPAAPADRALSAELAGYAVDQHRSLAAAKRDLSREAATEASFDHQLGGITFPPAADPHADLLIAADQKRIKLIRLQMQARTLRKVRSFNARDQAANAVVEAQVRIIRHDLGLPAATPELY
jgi:hypothetical protein